MIKVYQKECTGCGAHKEAMAKLRKYAAAKKETIQIIRTPLSQKLYDEAKSYQLSQPFAVIDDTAYPLGELPKKTRKRIKVAADSIASESTDGVEK